MNGLEVFIVSGNFEALERCEGPVSMFYNNGLLTNSRLNLSKNLLKFSLCSR